MMRPARVVFFGTPQVAVPSLDALADADDLRVVAVVTNPDRARGRSGRPQPSAVKLAAQRLGLPIIQDTDTGALATRLAACEPDIGAIVAYGKILPASLLAIAPHGCVNLHFSLLPRWRGAAPVQHALRAGDDVTGVTTFVLDEGMDTGPVLAQRAVAIDPQDDAGQLLDRLSMIGASLLVDSVRARLRGGQGTPQTDDGATLAPRIGTSDLVIDWTLPAATIVGLVRSASPVPGARTSLHGETVKILNASTATVPDRKPGDAVGTVIESSRHGGIALSGDGYVRITEVQPAGRRRMAWASFVNGYGDPTGSILGD